MARAYFVGLKEKKLYQQYLRNATSITIKIAKKTGVTAQNVGLQHPSQFK